MYRPAVVAVTVLLLALRAASPAAAQHTTPAAVLERGFAALNAGDVEGALALFSEDAVVRQEAIGPERTYRGKSEIRRWLSGAVSAGVRSELVRVEEVTGDTWRWVQRETDEGLRRQGIGWLEVIAVAQVRDGRVVSLSFRMARDEWERVQDARVAARGLPPRLRPTYAPVALPVVLGTALAAFGLPVAGITLLGAAALRVMRLKEGA